MITPLDALAGLGIYFAAVFIFALVWKRREDRNKKISEAPAIPGGNYDFRAKSCEPTASSRP
jgi:hypothetical protein